MARLGWSHRRSPQMLTEKFACPPVGERRRSGIVVRPIMPSKGVALTGVAINCRVWLAGESRLDLSLRGLGNELVLFPQMHKQGRTKIVDLFQVLFGVSAVIGDGCIDVAAHGRQERH